MTLIDPNKAAYVVVDLETTGLDVDKDLPLEVGVGVFDEQLNELAMNSWYIKPDGWRNRLDMNEYVKDMHTTNGLIADLNALPEFYMETDAEGKQQQLDYSMPMVSFLSWRWLVDTCGLTSNTFPLTGSSVGSLDKPFLRKRMPSLHGFFTYRSIDISSLKELCKRHNPALYREMNLQPPFLDANKAHRVRDDVRSSAAELKFYIEHFLNVQPSELNVIGQAELPLFGPMT